MRHACLRRPCTAHAIRHPFRLIKTAIALAGIRERHGLDIKLRFGLPGKGEIPCHANIPKPRLHALLRCRNALILQGMNDVAKRRVVIETGNNHAGKRQISGTGKRMMRIIRAKALGTRVAQDAFCPCLARIAPPYSMRSACHAKRRIHGIENNGPNFRKPLHGFSIQEVSVYGRDYGCEHLAISKRAKGTSYWLLVMGFGLRGVWLTAHGPIAQGSRPTDLRSYEPKGMGQRAKGSGKILSPLRQPRPMHFPHPATLLPTPYGVNGFTSYTVASHFPP